MTHVRGFRSSTRALVSISVAVGLGACATAPPPPVVSAAEVASFTSAYPPELQRLYAQVLIQGHRNAVLNYMRAGLAALDQGAVDAAGRSFDQALNTIEAVYADNPDAEKARSLWYKESAKDFKGEPYERAMAYYYRGIVYSMSGDFANARVSFHGGLLQDTFIEENERTKADFGAMSFLEGWAGRCAGLDATTVHASFSEAAERNTSLAEPPPGDTLLAIFESGSGPVKSQTGSHHEVLRYGAGRLAPLPAVVMSSGGKKQTAVLAADLLYKASTRGGRPVDEINQGKVVYKDATKTGADVAKVAGAGLIGASVISGNRNVGYAGLGLLAAGLIADAVSEAMKTDADARQWDNLPGNILISTFPMPAANPANVQVSFSRAGPEEQRQMAVRRAGGAKCAIAWGRELGAGGIPDTAPYTVTASR